MFSDTVRYLHVPLDDKPEENIHGWFRKANEFINSAISQDTPSAASKRNVVLVHCNLGRSRSSTIVLGYLISVKRMELLKASNFLKSCRPTAAPNIGFLEQLLKFEEETLGSKSEFHDLPF